MSEKKIGVGEWVLTYGWAILVVLAAIGALAYFVTIGPRVCRGSACCIGNDTTCFEGAARSTADAACAALVVVNESRDVSSSTKYSPSNRLLEDLMAFNAETNNTAMLSSPSRRVEYFTNTTHGLIGVICFTPVDLVINPRADWVGAYAVPVSVMTQLNVSAIAALTGG